VNYGVGFLREKVKSVSDMVLRRSLSEESLWKKCWKPCPFGFSNSILEDFFILPVDSESFLQVNEYGLAFFLADFLSNVRLYGQLVSAVSQSHERTLERMTVDRAADSHETSRPKERG
jgi:hypothetical protein